MIVVVFVVETEAKGSLTLQQGAEHRARPDFFPKSAIFDGLVARRVLAHCLPCISIKSLYFAVILLAIDLYLKSALNGTKNIKKLGVN